MGNFITEDFWFIVETEGNEDEIEIKEFESRSIRFDDRCASHAGQCAGLGVLSLDHLRRPGGFHAGAVEPATRKSVVTEGQGAKVSRSRKSRMRLAK